MTLATWLTVVSICILGAMSPGPSLAVVLKQTLAGGRRNGIVAAVLHGLGVGLYALLSIIGLAAIITASPMAFTVLQWGGALYLAWLGVKGLTARRRDDDALPEVPTTGSAARDGFLVVFLNPKIAVFFIALFSQFIAVADSVTETLLIVVTPAIVDALWYTLVAFVLSSPAVVERVQRKAAIIDKLTGGVLILLAIKAVSL